MRLRSSQVRSRLIEHSLHKLEDLLERLALSGDVGCNVAERRV